MKTVLTFKPSGQGHCLYTEVIDLAALGLLSVSRATNVEFNPDRQLWEVIEDDEVIFSDPSRQTCLLWEQRHFNR
jgi:hypothetical protein